MVQDRDARAEHMEVVLRKLRDVWMIESAGTTDTTRPR
jgi:hypothetical protein